MDDIVDMIVTAISVGLGEPEPPEDEDDCPDY